MSLAAQTVVRLISVRTVNGEDRVHRIADLAFGVHCIETQSVIAGCLEYLFHLAFAAGVFETASGFFFELKLKSKLKMGQIANVALNLPTENEPTMVKVRLINQTERGVGCAFLDLTPTQRKAIHACFETFKDTLPIN